MKNKKYLFFISLVFLCAFSIRFVQARDITSFNEGWSFKKGPFAKDPLLFSAGFDARWQDVTIPHTWNATDMQTEMNNYYAGEAYYKKQYTPAAELKGKRVFLRFQGVGSVADVYINKTYAGNHKGAYSAFAIEISKLLKYGESNEILVKVDNSPRPNVIPVNNTLFGVYGGIYRPVELIVTEPVNIAVTDYASPGIYISQKNVNRKSADVNIKIKLENKKAQAKKIVVSTTIYERDGRVKAQQQFPVTVSPQGRQIYDQDFTIKNPHLWQGLEDPYLYKVVVNLLADGKVIDEVSQPLGLRHYELKAADGMYLNGKKVPMYGVCRHQDWWKLGSALTDKEHDTDLAIIREIGATTIRFAHYQQAERIYAKCDSIGFMVWAEIPFVNRVSTQESGNAKQQLVELIRQNYNHPSIYIWGLHNEVYAPYNYTVSLTTELNDLAKTEDPYRLTASVNGYSVVNQESNLNADVQGINHYFGWYGGKIGDIEKWVKARNMKGLVTFDRQTKKDPFYWYKANWSKEPVLYITQRRATERENEVTPVTVYCNVGVPRLFVNGTEVKTVSKGQTSVHYIFENVTLNKGENVIEARVDHQGKTLEDTIRWSYSPENKNRLNLSDPKEKTKEHVGL